MNESHFSVRSKVIADLVVLSDATVVGYAAVIHSLGLQMPMPSTIAVVVNSPGRRFEGGFNYFHTAYSPKDNADLDRITALYNHLVFALKYEGVDLLFFKKLTACLSKEECVQLVSVEPTGQYSRRIWFLIEWLIGERLAIDDLTKKSYVEVIDTRLQYAVAGVRSPRHKVINNLPGCVGFCPMIRKTAKLNAYVSADFADRASRLLNGFRKDVLQRAAAFLMLKDSKASFTIEGESAKGKRAALWGQAIAQAGKNDLSVDELCRLQNMVIENARFMQMGIRKQGGFVGGHDRVTGEPIPDHISAKHEDIEALLQAFTETSQLLVSDSIDAGVAATKLAFGFVFIHPFVDGNGRIHRYLIHHVLAAKGFASKGVVFPVSAAILDAIDEYRKVLEAYSKPLLAFIDWMETPDHNVAVNNETIDFYRYIDLTLQAEFLYGCIEKTLNDIIPKEVGYLLAYDEFKGFVDGLIEMPDSTVALMVRFLEQNNGRFSKRALTNEFAALTLEEVTKVEAEYKRVFGAAD
ncbi:MAG: Fic family protein [Flavobacteriales bacterium]